MSRDDLMLAAMEIREECKAHPVSCVGCSWFTGFNETDVPCAFAACNCPEEWRFRIYINEEGKE